MATEYENIPALTMEGFKSVPESMDYVDDDFAISHNINISRGAPTLRVNVFLFVSCLEGRTQLEMNGRQYTLETGEMFVCLPTSIVSQVMVSPDNRIRLVAFSTSFLRGILRQESDVDKVFAYLYTNPVQRTRQTPAYARYYGLLLEAKIAQPEHRFRRETLRFLMSTMISEMLEAVLAYIAEDGVDQSRIDVRGGYKRSNYVFREFLRTLSADNGMHRSVAYFAERLCYSPKYLSSVVRHVSGRTALDWINEYTLEQVKHRLKHSDKTIKEIAEELNFSNQSFFGKYVKTHLGMSPAKYRESGE